MKSILLSIIIPCFNSERFISKTLDMLISQGLNDCEIIIVNDGSTDKTSQIIHSYDSKILNLKIIDKKNEGVSVARNIGIENAKGKYIYFLDSDDTLTDGTLDFYKTLLNSNSKKNIFGFGYKSINIGTIKKYSYKRFDNKNISNPLLFKLFLSKRLNFHICSLIYKKEFLVDNSIFFRPNLKIGEDLEFIIKSLQNTTELFYVSRICYVYLIRSDSALQRDKIYTHTSLESLKNLSNILLPLLDNEEYKKYIAFFMQVRVLNHYMSYLKSNLKDTFITEYISTSLDIFKYKISFGDLKIWICLKFFRHIPLKKLLIKTKLINHSIKESQK